MKRSPAVANRVACLVAGLAFSLLSSLAEAALVVGVTDQHLDPDHNVVENCYVESLAAAGHVPVVVPCVTNDAALAEIVAKLDVLIFTGGADVETARYRTPRAPKCGDPDLLRDDFEFRLLAAARARRLPIMGVCRGCQLVNVGFGGTLWQDLPSEFPKGTDETCHGAGEYLHPERHPAAHQVKIMPGTRLASVLGTENLAVNSHHHQAVKKIAPGFRVTAVAPDGVIEGIESTDYPAFCVQFHPEAIVARAKGNAAYDHARMTKLFTALADLCGTADLADERTIDENLSVLISDIHIQTDPAAPYAFTAREFPKRVKEILAMRPLPRRVICFGDMTFNGGEPASYAFLREQIRPLEAAGIRVVLGMGNHDRRRNFLAAFPEAGKGQPVPGRIVYKVDLGQCDLILLDTLDAQERSVGGEIGAEQEAWLRREVAAAKRPVFLGAHHRPAELSVGGRPLLEFLRSSDKVVGWINGHGHYWHKENLCWGGGCNEDVVRSLMLPTGGAWGEIGTVTLRTYPDRAEAKLKMIDMVWHDALKPGEKRPKVYDAIVADQNGDRIVFPYERPMLRATP